MKIKLLTAALMMVAGGAAMAQAATPATPAVPGNPTATPRAERREMNQERRIQQGVASGQLTQREAGRLQAEQGRIEHAEERAKADGHVTAQERARLARMQDHANRDIYREKHDRQRDMDHDGRKDRPHVERPHGKFRS